MIPTSLQGLRARRVGLAGPVPVDVTRRLAGRPDGLSFGHGGRTLLGVGYAARLALPGGTQDGAGLRAVTAALSAVPAEDRLTGGGGDGDGAGDPLPHPVTAFGALPFRPEDPTVLVVPRILVGLEEDGTAWMSVVGSPPDLPEDAAAADALLASLSDPAGDTVTDRVPGEADGHGTDPDRARPTRRGDDRATFVEAVARALEAIDRGRLRKVVLGRRAEMVLPEPLPVGDLVDRWAALEPACTTFSLPVAPESGGGIMVGASPELLVARRGPDLTTRPLAGTTRHVGDRDRPVAGGMPLARSPKDGLEHRLVVEAIADRLAPRCTELSVPDRPGLHHLRSITHLATEIRGRLRSGADGDLPSALELAGLLHPTPAVGGVPVEAALELIGRLEPHARHTFAGPVGYVDGAGDGTWVVGIRSLVCGAASGDRRRLRLWAGVGIVEGSVPSAEWSETELKLEAVVDAVRAVTRDVART